MSSQPLFGPSVWLRSLLTLTPFPRALGHSVTWCLFWFIPPGMILFIGPIVFSFLECRLHGSEINNK